MKLFFICFIFLFLASCSSIKPLHHTVVDHDGNGVDLTGDLNSPIGNNENPAEKVQIEKTIETVRIGDHGGDIFENKTADGVRPNIENLKIGLVMGPGLNRTINYISLLKFLEKNNLTPVVMTGAELGAVVAALYASGITTEMIEWMYFKYFKEKKNYKTYEKEWIAEIDEYFLSKLKYSKIEETKIKFFITLFDHNTKKAYYFDKGNIRDILLISLRLMNNPLKYKTGQVYSGAIEKEIFNSRLMTTLGSNFNIAADSLIHKIDFENTNENTNAVLARVSAHSAFEKKSFDYVFNLPSQNMKLDSTKNASSSISSTQEFLNKQAVILKKKIEVKKDLLNSQSEVKE